MLGLCRLLLADPDEADDVSQEILLKLYRAHQTSPEPIAWGRWLTRVTVNACRDRRRSGWWRWWRDGHREFEEADHPAKTMRCLGEKAMLSVAGGEGEFGEQRVHLRSCERCGREYARLLRELDIVVGELRKGPPVRADSRSRRATALRWAAVPAAAALLLAVAVGLLWKRPPEPVTEVAAVANPDLLAEEVSAAVFSAGERAHNVRVVGGARYLRAAFGTDGPCTSELFVDEGCDDHLSALLFVAE